MENPGEGVTVVFAKIPGGGGQGSQEKLPGGDLLFRVLLHFNLQVLRNFPWGVLYLPNPLPPSTTMCASLAVIKIDRFGHKNNIFSFSLHDIIPVSA